MLDLTDRNFDFLVRALYCKFGNKNQKNPGQTTFSSKTEKVVCPGYMFPNSWHFARRTLGPD
ncbi:hypothetical protein D3871_19805 [Noviherbaspirillum saxi]|uniref:Uncharacterized protein n=1 Tax=Noviherbaspirillum saxi TaxID=2320863 RepID=A0A3A3FQ96_9BURK|nr:hypothetical protein D3871_19805 [Noviherbaspirillum saxi]